MRRIFWFFLLCSFVLLPCWGEAKSYFHPVIKQVFTFQENGDALVEEKRSFSFEGSFSWARLSIFRKGVEDIVFEGVWDEKAGEACPCEVERTPQEVGIRWSYQAQDEVRTFRLRYRLVGVVRRFEDVAEFYWKVIEDKHAQIEELRSTFVLPGESPELLKLFVHTQASPGEMEFPEDRKSVSFRLQDVPADTFVEARLLTSPRVFPAVPLRGGHRYEAILEEERGFVQKTSRSFYRGALVVLFFGGFWVLYLVLFLVFYFRYGREPRLSYEREYEQEPPEWFPTVFLGVLLSQKKNLPLLVRAFFATVLDLACRGYLTVHEEEKRGLLFGRNPLAFRLTEKGENEKEWEKELNPFEQEVLALLRRLRPSSDSAVTIKDIEDWARETDGGKSNLLHLLERWDGELRRQIEKDHFPILDRTSERKRNIFIGLGISAFAAGLVVIFLGFWSLGFFVALLVPLLVFIVLLVPLGYRFLSRWSPEAALMYRRFMAFRRFLSDFSLLREASTHLLALWDRYLVYAVVLGVAEKLLRNIKRYGEETQTVFRAPSWYYPMQGTEAGLASLGGLAHLDALAHSIQNMANLERALSTSSTSGGGFSGGGGGGGGGGSSSAG
ncbi:MAG: DUF2207 family protein [Candidatus Caldatribacteriaceae bacterium]